MGEDMFKEYWSKDVIEDIKRIRNRIGNIEAIFIFGSWVKSGGGEWSDIDLLLISSAIHNIHPLERFKIISELQSGKVDLFIYSYKELERMVYKGNPLALSALIEGKPVIASTRVLKLAEKAKEMYIRVNRMWIRRSK